MMRSIAAVLSACLLSCAFALPASSAENPNFEPKEINFGESADWSRVVGGSQASSGQFPYMASLRQFGSHLCGASIISKVYLLTAAHCTFGTPVSVLTAVVGTTTLNSGGTRYAISNIINHPNYNATTTENDISLLKTKSAIVGSNVVASISISSGNLGAGVTVILSGWGRLSASGSAPNDLQYISLRTINNTECAQRHPDTPVFATNLCTFTKAGEGACFGDSGGPLAAEGVLVGIVSWGRPCGVGYPDAFTRVSSYFDWIRENAT